MQCVIKGLWNSATDMKMADIEHLPPNLLKIAVTLRNSSRTIFITLCHCKEPVSASKLAELVGESRAYVNMRLLQLVDQDLVKESKGENPREKLYTVVQ